MSTLKSESNDVYIFCTYDGGVDWMSFAIVDQEGVVHGSHICSDISFAMGDLYSNRLSVQRALRDKFPEGFQVWLLPAGCMPPPEVVAKNGLLQEVVDIALARL